MAAELIDKKITQDQADRMTAPMELDLTAVFKLIEQDAIDLADNYEGSPDNFIDELLGLLKE